MVVLCSRYCAAMVMELETLLLLVTVLPVWLELLCQVS